MIRVDKGPEFLAQSLQDWGKANRVLIYHIQPGRPTHNANIARFNRTYRNDVREPTARWMTIYNEQRPHDSLHGTVPCMYAPSQPRNSSYELSA